ncbi:MAG: squalene/phytoene synthase family protein [Pseudomonadota bacterium]
MAEPELSPTEQLVREGDPDLFLAALFTAEPLRGRLMTLIAFDIELAKASRRSADPIINSLRLQWWRDVVDEAAMGDPPRAHDVAGPLARLVRDASLSAEQFEPLMAGYEREASAPFDAHGFDAWADQRFGGFLALAARLVAEDHPEVISAMGRAMALDFALRNARAMAGDGIYLLPLAGLDRASLARGETTDTMREMIAARADQALKALQAARRSPVPAALKPILRLGWRVRSGLKRAKRPDLDLARDFLQPPGFAAARLLSLSLTGRW